VSNRVTRRIGLVGVSAAVASGLGACGPGQGAPAEESAGAAAPGNRRLKIGTSFSITTLNPVEGGSLGTYGAGDTLYRLLPNQTQAPWIATSITPTGEEGYTIKLNPAARFHNGKPIDAKTVQACLERYAAAGVIPTSSLNGARYETPDAQTLRIATSVPDPWLPSYFAYSRAPIFDASEVPDKVDPATLAGKGYLSGPFRVTGLTPQQMTLDAVPTAWDGPPRLAGVDLKFIQDAHARVLALKTGEIDMLLYAPADAVPQFRPADNLYFKTTRSHELVLVWLNHTRPPFNELAVRQALALAIDRAQIANQVLNGAYETRDSFYPKDVSWSVPGLVRTDQAGARRLLDGAGWLPGPDGVRVKDGRRLSFEWLHYPQQPDSKPLSEAVQAQLKAVGMEVRLKQSDDITSALRSKQFDAGVSYNGMLDGGSPMVRFNSYYKTDSANNYGGWGSAELDRAITALGREFDAAKRAQLLRQVQELFARDVPITFVVSKHWSAAVNADFRDYTPPVWIGEGVVTKDTAPAARR
jgi:peptide/nickel transport system substrate-binding protein